VVPEPVLVLLGAPVLVLLGAPVLVLVGAAVLALPAGWPVARAGPLACSPPVGLVDAGVAVDPPLGMVMVLS